MIEYVIKRNGSQEPFNPEKFNKLTKWSAFEGEDKVDWSHLALKTIRKLHNGCTTKEIVQAMINACLEETTEAYFYVAGKLLASVLHKEVHKDFIPSLLDHLENCEDLGVYLNFLDYYSEDEVEELDTLIDHAKDFSLTHSQLNQMQGKYLVKIKGELKETPQFMFMRVAMAVCMFEDNKVEKAKELYDHLSNFRLVLPTPMWTNLGTPQKTGSSCLLYSVKDTVGSLTAGDHITNVMTVAGAGIGSVLFTRSKKDPIQGGRLEHLGKIPYYRLLQANIQATMQSGSRRGAATTHINCLDPEIEVLLHLRNPTSIDEEKVDDIDYSFTFNNFFAERVKNNESWLLISQYYAPDLWEAMFTDDQLFAELYKKYEQADVPKKIIKARDLALAFLKEQLETGRLYEFNASNVNNHTPFKDPIYSSNLCQEITLPTKPYSSVVELYKAEYEEGDGYVQTCNLCAINLLDYTDEEYYRLAYWALKIIDFVIEHSDYRLPQIGATTKKWRSAGVSFINLAHYLAKNYLVFNSPEGLARIHWLAERHEYMLTKASLQLGKELGNAEWIHKTKYPEGWLPIDTYNKNVDKITPNTLTYDWEGLRQEVIANKGIRNSVLSTMVPSESCLKYDTEVVTSDGNITLKEILEEYAGVLMEDAQKVHDVFSGGQWYELQRPLEALTEEGYKPIPRVWYNGTTPLFRIELEDGSVTFATANHKFLTEEGWKPASLLVEGEELL